MSTTITCNISKQEGISRDCTAVFSSAGILLIVEGLPLGEHLPYKFEASFEDFDFGVTLEGGDHVVNADDRDAFTAMVFG